MKKPGLQHLTANERAALDDFVRRLRAKYADEVLLVRLFGSKARGDFDAESDIDVLVVVREDDWRFNRQIVGEAWDPMFEHNVVISPTVVCYDHYRWLGDVTAPFYRAIQRDGIDLWTRRRARLSLSA